MKYKMTESESGINISVDDIKGKKDKLLEAFQECKEGRCTCPTEEYKNMDSMEVDHNDESIQLRLKSKKGVKIDKTEIKSCLEYTAERIKHDDSK